MICTFFGHRDAPESIRASLANQIEELILHHGVNTFYYGNHGNFDAMVAHELKKAKRRHPSISCILVLAYLPTNRLQIRKRSFPKESNRFQKGLRFPFATDICSAHHST